jgi:hypothetical protein
VGHGHRGDATEFAIAAWARREPDQRDPIERGIVGWKEFELEVMRDAPTTAVVCSIENSIRWACHATGSRSLAQTLSDVEYQRMRDAAFAQHPGAETAAATSSCGQPRPAIRSGRDEPAREPVVRTRAEGDWFPSQRRTRLRFGTA